MKRSTPSVCLVEPGCLTKEHDEPSLESGSNSARSATSKGTRSARKSSARASQTDCSTMHPSGLMCRTSREFAIGVMLERLSADFLASPFRTQGIEVARRMSDICSGTLYESLLNLEPKLSSSKTSPDYSVPCVERLWKERQVNLFSQHQSETFLDSWPKTGLMRGGQVWGLKMSGLRTEDSDSGALPGAWPTPMVPNGGRSPKDGAMSLTGQTPSGKKRQVDLAFAVKHDANWPTPSTEDGKSDGPKSAARMFTEDMKTSDRRLRNFVQAWSSPRASDGPNGGPNMRGSKGDMALPGQVLVESNWATPPNNWSSPVSSLNANRTTKIAPSTVDGKHGGHLSAEVLQNWSTPKVTTGDYTRDGGDKGKERLTLQGEVANWSTPCGHDGHIGYQSRPEGKKGSQVNVETQVRNQAWGTPTASTTAKGTTAKGTTAHSSMLAHGHLVAQVEEHSDAHRKMHRLNPDWEELLMSWPIGWTDPSKPCSGIFPGFPAGQGVYQHPYEPARTVHRDESPNRTKRVSAIGNGVCTMTAELAYYLLLTESL